MNVQVKIADNSVSKPVEVKQTLHAWDFLPLMVFILILAVALTISIYFKAPEIGGLMGVVSGAAGALGTIGAIKVINSRTQKQGADRRILFAQHLNEPSPTASDALKQKLIRSGDTTGIAPLERVHIGDPREGFSVENKTDQTIETMLGSSPEELALNSIVSVNAKAFVMEKLQDALKDVDFCGGTEIKNLRGKVVFLSGESYNETSYSDSGERADSIVEGDPHIEIMFAFDTQGSIPSKFPSYNPFRNPLCGSYVGKVRYDLSGEDGNVSLHVVPVLSHVTEKIKQDFEKKIGSTQQCIKDGISAFLIDPGSNRSKQEHEEIGVPEDFCNEKDMDRLSSIIEAPSNPLSKVKDLYNQTVESSLEKLNEGSEEAQNVDSLQNKYKEKFTRWLMSPSFWAEETAVLTPCLDGGLKGCPSFLEAYDHTKAGPSHQSVSLIEDGEELTLEFTQVYEGKESFQHPLRIIMFRNLTDLNEQTKMRIEQMPFGED